MLKPPSKPLKPSRRSTDESAAMITKRHALQDACEVIRYHQGLYNFRLYEPPLVVQPIHSSPDNSSAMLPSQARRRTVGDREDGRSKAAYHSVVSIYAEAAPDGLDQRVGGHRERIAEGKSSHTSAPLPLENASVSRGYGGVLSPSLHPAEL